jgi:hypothetical protein
MIKKAYLTPTAVVLTLLMSFAAKAQSEEAMVKQTITNLFDGMRQSDTAKMRAAFAPGGILQSVFKNREGKTVVQSEAVDSFLYSIAKPHTEVYDEKIVFETIKIDGELATVWTPYKFYVGSKFSHCGVDSYQLVKLNGTWKIQYLIDTRRRQGCDSLPGF